MHAVFFERSLNPTFKEAVEKVLFFNSNQRKLLKKIEKQIEKYGTPSIKVEDQQVKIVFDDSVSYPTLYVLSSKSSNADLLGMLIYEIDGNTCQIIHLAINEYCVYRIEENELILLRLMEKLRKEMMETKVEYINLPYSDKRISVERNFTNAWV